MNQPGLKFMVNLTNRSDLSVSLFMAILDKLQENNHEFHYKSLFLLTKCVSHYVFPRLYLVFLSKLSCYCAIWSFTSVCFDLCFVLLDAISVQGLNLTLMSCVDKLLIGWDYERAKRPYPILRLFTTNCCYLSLSDNSIILNTNNIKSQSSGHKTFRVRQSPYNQLPRSTRFIPVTKSVMSHLKRAINCDKITNNKRRKDCLMTRGKDHTNNDWH